MEHARQATAADLPVLARLWQTAIEELAEERGGRLFAWGLARKGVLASLEGGVDDSGRLLVVGLIDEVPVGLASVSCFQVRSEVVGDLELVYVEPRARQVGVAEAMLNLAMSWCRERGCEGIDAPALPGSRSAKSFFEDNGFQARLLIMHRSFDRSPAGADADDEFDED